VSQRPETLTHPPRKTTDNGEEQIGFRQRGAGNKSVGAIGWGRRQGRRGKKGEARNHLCAGDMRQQEAVVTREQQQRGRKETFRWRRGSVGAHRRSNTATLTAARGQKDGGLRVRMDEDERRRKGRVYLVVIFFLFFFQVVVSVDDLLQAIDLRNE
jgi:hypothetical protein